MGETCSPICVPVGVVGKVLFLFLPLPSLTKSEEELQTLEGGGCKRIGALAHSPPSLLPQCACSLFHSCFPLAVTLILPSFLACGLALHSPLLSSWQLLIQMPPERGGEGQVKRHAWKVLETKMGSAPHSIRPHIGFPFPLTIGATLAVVWVLSGALVPPLLLHLPTCSALQGEGKKRGVCFWPRSSSWCSSLALAWGRGHEMPFPGLSVVEVGVGHASILQFGGRYADSMMLLQLGEAGLLPCA